MDRRHPAASHSKRREGCEQRGLDAHIVPALCDTWRESTVRESMTLTGAIGMARCPKLAQEMVDEAIRLKADGLSNGDVICALGIHESTFYRWSGDPETRLQRELSEGLKRRRARSSGRCSPRSARRRWRRTSTGRPPRGCSSASTPTRAEPVSPSTTASSRTRRQRSDRIWTRLRPNSYKVGSTSPSGTAQVKLRLIVSRVCLDTSRRMIPATVPMLARSGVFWMRHADTRIT